MKIRTSDVFHCAYTILICSLAGEIVIKVPSVA